MVGAMRPILPVAVILPLLLAWLAVSRREAWGAVRKHPAGMSGAVMLLVALVLMTPWASQTFGSPLHWLTGWWNLEDLVGHGFTLFGLALVDAALVGRLNGEGVSRAYRLSVQLPMTVCIPMMVLVFRLSNISRDPYPDLFTATGGVWTDLYWIFYAAMVAWLLIFGALEVVVTQRRWSVVGIRLVVAVLGVAAVVVQVVTSLLDISHSGAVWVLAWLGVLGFLFIGAKGNNRTRM